MDVQDLRSGRLRLAGLHKLRRNHVCVLVRRFVRHARHADRCGDKGGHARRKWSPAKNQGGMAVVQTIKSYDVRFTSEGSKVQRQNVYETDVARTLDSGAGQPQNSQGGVAVVSIQGSMIGRKDENGPQGSGVKEDVSFTLNTCDKLS